MKIEVIVVETDSFWKAGRAATEYNGDSVFRVIHYDRFEAFFVWLRLDELFEFSKSGGLFEDNHLRFKFGVF